MGGWPGAPRLAQPVVLAVVLLAAMAPVAHAATSAGAGVAGLGGLGYAFATILVFIGAIAYALGRSDIAKSSWMWAIVVAIIVAWVSSHAGGGLPGAAGEAKVFWPPAEFYTKVPVTVVIAQPGAKVSATIDWGDGSTSECSGLGYCVASHSYGSDGRYTIRVSGAVSGSFNITVEGFGERLERQLTAAAGGCGIRNIQGCVIEGVAKILGKMVDAAIDLMGLTHTGGLFESVARMMVTVPDNPPPIMDLTGYAWWLLGYAVIGLALWRAYWEFEKGLSWLDALREVAYVLLALSIAQPLYVWAARIVNSVSLSIAQPGILMSWMALFLAFTGLAAALPVGGAGSLALAGVAGFAGIIIFAMLKYLLLEALYFLLPIIAVLWLFPPTRGVARQLSNVMVSLMAWNLVLAALIRLSGEAIANPTSMSMLEVVGYGLAMPFIMLLSGAMIGGLTGGLPIPGAGLFASLYGRIGGLLAARLGAATAATTMLAPPGAIVGHTEYIRPPMHPAAPAGAAAGVGVGTPMTVGVPTPSSTTAPAKTEWLRPSTAGPGQAWAGPSTAPEVRPVEELGRGPVGYEVAGEKAARSIAKAQAEEMAKDMGIELEKKPQVEEVPPATQRVKEGLKEAVSKPAKPVAERVKREVGAIREAVSQVEGGKAAKAAAVAGAVAARLHAYMSNRVRQFIREFSVTFEKQTGIKVPAKLKELQPLAWERIEQRVKTGAEAGAIIGQTIYMKIKKPFERSEQIVKASSGRSSVYKFRFR